MRRLVLACAVALVLPATAEAAPLHELPYAERAAVGCLAPTGVPGGLSIGGAFSKQDVTTDLLIAGPDGVAPAAGLSVGRLFACAAVVESPDGTAVVAGGVEGAEELEDRPIHAAIRDPGGAFGAPVELGRGDPDPAVAVGPAGHAVVAWVEHTRRREAIVAVRRGPGEAFGPPETVLAWRSRPYYFSFVELRAGLDAAGRVTLLWRRDLPVSQETRVEAASAAPGAPFAVQRLAARVEFPEPVLAVAPDGWTLAVHGDWGGGGAIFERAPGASSFTRVALAPPSGSDQPVVAIRDGGGALVGWRRMARERIEVATREGASPFGTPRVVARGWSVNEIDTFDELAYLYRDRLLLPPADLEEPRLRAALASDGRALLAWAGAAGRTLLWSGSTHAVLGRLGGAFEPARRIGGTLRDTEDVAPLFLPDGRAAVAWTDRTGRADGRLHLAVEGAPALAADPVRLRVRAPRFQRLARGESPRVTAVCSGPCDVRAAVSVLYGDASPRSVTNPTGGALRLQLGRVHDIRRPQWVKVRVHAGPPGGRATASRTVRLRLVRR